MPSKILSAAVIGFNSEIIEVEADVTGGLGSFTIVGLPDVAIQESRERVRLALKNSGMEFPQKRITVNLAPADIKKEGPLYDLPIALSVLMSSSQKQFPNLERDFSVFIGELALDGSVRPVRGVLSIAMMCRQLGLTYLYLPKKNALEASLVKGIKIIPVKSFSDLVKHLSSIDLIPPQIQQKMRVKINYPHDMRDIRGQEQAKRALEIAAAGNHNIAMSGPPGSGKTMLARTLPSILPEASFEESLEINKIYSIAGKLPKNEPILGIRPFRSPHHTSSAIALIGGGSKPKPGEISLAHRGVLFLDEFPEFSRQVLESLRQPLEDGFVTVSRAHASYDFPAQFMLIAALNPCPCGYLTDPDKECACSSTQIIKYARRLSGPLMDRIDIHIEVPKVNVEKLTSVSPSENSENIRKRIQNARDRQKERFCGATIFTNAEMNSKMVNKFCALPENASQILKNAIGQFNLSARSYFKVLKIARTIADMEKEKNISHIHIAEALRFRPKTD